MNDLVYRACKRVVSQGYFTIQENEELIDFMAGKDQPKNQTPANNVGFKSQMVIVNLYDTNLKVVSKVVKIPSEIHYAIKKLIEAGKKFDAIRLLRAVSGIGLREAKDAVEYFLNWDKDYLNPINYEHQM